MTDPKRVIDMASAFYDSCVLFTASELGVFGALAEAGALDAEALIGRLGLDARGGRLLLDACVAVGLLRKEDGAYANTDAAGAFLVPGAPGSLVDAIRYNRDVYAAWGNLADLARTGEPVEKPALHLGEDPERTRTFVLSMHSRALGIGRAVVPQLDLTGCRKLLDVGGGPGTYSVLIAQAHPEIACTVLDLPAVVAVAKELIADQGMADRVATLAGDYHTTAFPSGLDAVLFFGMLHQESPEAIADLLKRARDALRPGGSVYVMDMMTEPSRTAPKFSALFAVNMALTTAHGWVFSDADLRGWMEAAGFGEVTVTPLAPPMPHWLASARKR